MKEIETLKQLLLNKSKFAYDKILNLALHKLDYAIANNGRIKQHLCNGQVIATDVIIDDAAILSLIDKDKLMSIDLNPYTAKSKLYFIHKDDIPFIYEKLNQLTALTEEETEIIAKVLHYIVNTIWNLEPNYPKLTYKEETFYTAEKFLIGFKFSYSDTLVAIKPNVYKKASKELADIIKEIITIYKDDLYNSSNP